MCTLVPFITNPHSQYRDTIRVNVFVERLRKIYGWQDEYHLLNLITAAQDIFTKLNEKDKSIFQNEFIKQLDVDFCDAKAVAAIKARHDELWLAFFAPQEEVEKHYYRNENIHYVVKNDIEHFHQVSLELADEVIDDYSFDMADHSVVTKCYVRDSVLNSIIEQINEHPNYAAEFSKRIKNNDWLKRQLSANTLAILASFN